MKAPKHFFLLGSPSTNKVVEAWHLVVCLLAIHYAVDDCFDLILLVISCLKLKLFFWLWQSFIHLPLPSSILL